MCCRLTVFPLDPEIAAAVLGVGLFVPVEGYPNNWRRFVPEENTTVQAILLTEANLLRIELSPSISQYMHHADKRIAGGVYFEIAAKYAEKVNGRIVQLSNVAGCVEGGRPEHLLAAYPDYPMMWDQVCPGFRETILGRSVS